MGQPTQTAVIEVKGVHWASSKAVAESVLGRRPGVSQVEANPVAQTATVTFDPEQTTIAELAGWVRDCGYHCAGRSVPDHICDPMAEAYGPDHAPDHAPADAGHAPATRSAQDAMGHGGHGEMSMDAMIRDMRNRFAVAAVLSVPITLWSPIGREVLGFTVPAPFGLRDDVFALILSLPVIFYAAWIFFDGAYRALRARTLDMMVLVAVGVGGRLALQPGRDAHRRRRGVLRGGHRAGQLRAARALVRDARAGRCERRRAHPARARPAPGAGDP